MNKIEILKQIQADSLVFFMKTHNYHWNVKGRDFPQVHKATEEIYNIFAEVFDDVAERILQLNDIPLVSIVEVSKVAKIKEEARTSFKSEEVLKGVLSDYEYFLGLFKDLSKHSDEDISTQDYANSQIAHLEKAIWMIKSQLA